jgi:hypothetical protein
MSLFGKSGPMALYAIQGYSEKLAASGDPYGGRFFAAAKGILVRQYDHAMMEWESLKSTDLSAFWPHAELPEGFKTTYQRIPEHGYPTFESMFNARQLLGHCLLLKSIMSKSSEGYTSEAVEFVLGAFQNFLRNQNMFSFWHITLDKLAPAMSNNNYHPKANVVEVGLFSPVGYGPWKSTIKVLPSALEWKEAPWELVASTNLQREHPQVASEIQGKSEKVYPSDKVRSAQLFQGSATDIEEITAQSIDLVITDPPFGNNIQYAELADYFYVWLRLALKGKYPEKFSSILTPKAMEAVTNPVREKEDPEGFYKRLLTQSWLECHRILKDGGLLAFTFHHSEDEPWVSVLESLFDAGFYLEAAYPIRSDETKGEGSKPGTFGSQQIEYDIIHVCRKRTEEPKPVSWGRMRREVMADVRQLQGMLENHARAGLPAADLQVIRRGKALEYFSRHYGKVYVDEGRPISVKDALVGINQLIDEDANKTAEPPPVIAEPISRQFLRIFDGKIELARDQIQKLLRGSGIAPDEFESRGWCSEDKKVFHFVDPLAFARDWQGRHRRRLTADLDQALVMIGACYDGSGINASDTLKNDNFKPHPALKSLLEWLSKRGSSQPMRNAASRALSIYNGWAESNRDAVKQLSLFQE